MIEVDRAEDRELVAKPHQQGASGLQHRLKYRRQRFPNTFENRAAHVNSLGFLIRVKDDLRNYVYRVLKRTGAVMVRLAPGAGTGEALRTSASTS